MYFGSLVSVLPSSAIEIIHFRRRKTNSFIFCLSAYSVKWFSGIKSSVYEIGPIGINGLPDDEAITVQKPVTRCSCAGKDWEWFGIICIVCIHQYFIDCCIYSHRILCLLCVLWRGYSFSCCFLNHLCYRVRCNDLMVMLLSREISY
jgi:hypothetical protein